MKKINQNGFVLAETLVVAVFIMAIFTLIFSNFYPLIGEYEKRETYDDVDGKYAVYWIRRMIEDSAYQIPAETATFFNKHGYIRFQCSDIEDQEKRETCKNLVNNLQVKGCSGGGDNCEIYITKYQLKDGDNSGFFKKEIQSKIKRKDVNRNESSENENKFVESCKVGLTTPNAVDLCKEEANRREFRSGFIDYIETLPDYKKGALDGSKYRIIACFQHERGSNNYYSYATMEVSR